jgi:hypothetical protein
MLMNHCATLRIFKFFYTILRITINYGQVVKLANTLALGASAARLVGSTPTLPTNLQ